MMPSFLSTNQGIDNALATPSSNKTIPNKNIDCAGSNAVMSKGICIENAFSRASVGSIKNGAAFLTIKNMNIEVDNLIGAKTPIADRAELHTHLNKNGVMKMRRLDSIFLPSKGLLSMQPGGNHIMLLGLKSSLKKGDSFCLTLIFEKAGEITCNVSIGEIDAMHSPAAT
ncbi:copper chaperone PCu(A)C [Candidatus Endolissoclinum faulkneri]|nr:copper chaperone PCu(A)C [Candidatus Endolissoclinum faulkneri]